MSGATPGAWARVRETPSGDPIGCRMLVERFGAAVGGAELWRADDGRAYFVRPGDVMRDEPEPPKAPARRRALGRVAFRIAVLTRAAARFFSGLRW